MNSAMLGASSVETIEDAQTMREIRNSVREYMTRDTDDISPQRQYQWFYSMYASGKYDAYLFYSAHGCCVGYGMLTSSDDKVWGTLAVKKEFQNQGYGTAIYQHLIKTCAELDERYNDHFYKGQVYEHFSKLYKNLWIEIYADNAESLRAAQKAGFETVHVGDKVITLVHRGRNADES
jgi:GNAT superfamily N-acetyltransferase